MDFIRQYEEICIDNITKIGILIQSCVDIMFNDRLVYILATALAITQNSGNPTIGFKFKDGLQAVIIIITFYHRHTLYFCKKFVD